MKTKIKEIIETKVGRDKAITVASIADLIGMWNDSSLTNLQTRVLIKQLILEGLPIASCRDGYYIASDMEEFNDYLEDLNHRMNGIRQRRRAFIDAFRKRRS